MIRENVSLKPYNTFDLDVSAQKFAQFQSLEQLEELRLTDDFKFLPRLILGGGSNVLFTSDFPGLVLKNELHGIECIQQLPDGFIIKAGAGENWHQFVLTTLENGWYGLENLSLIPGNVGASPMQNIGAYGVEIKDVFHNLEAFHLPSGEVHIFDKADCKFGYRESVFKRELKDQYVIISVSFKLKKNSDLLVSYGSIQQELEKRHISHVTARDISNAVIAIRSAKLPDPKVLGNAGSFFKNPLIPKEHYQRLLKTYPQMPGYESGNNMMKVPAGWLIETLGWKGKVAGNAGMHKNQALVLVNYGRATGRELYDLSTAVINSVKETFDIELEREVNII